MVESYSSMITGPFMGWVPTSPRPMVAVTARHDPDRNKRTLLATALVGRRAAPVNFGCIFILQATCAQLQRDEFDLDVAGVVTEGRGVLAVQGFCANRNVSVSQRSARQQNHDF